MIPKEYRALAFMLTASFMFAALNCCIKILALEVDPFVILGYRNLFIAAPILVYLLFKKELVTNRPKLSKLNVYKGLVDFISIPMWSIAMVHLKVAEAVSISYITPIASIIFAIVLLKERPSKDKFIAIFIGVIGTYVTLVPSSGIINTYSLIVVFTSFLWASSNVMTKKLTETQDPVTIVLYTNVVSFLLVFPLFISKFTSINFDQFLMLLLLSFIAWAANFSVTKAYTMTQMTNLIPLDYTRLIFSTALGYSVFGEIVGFNTFLGTAIILFASLYLIRKVKKSKSLQEA